ncbi:MAG TPA: acetoacetate--CoA ligase [Solirubrobacteraceae bacterium]|jgi:acetoacetyl-CoA synthetase|nr:acetoacetate--CoA ligase [Solirubrobacteraceae bacterium]
MSLQGASRLWTPSADDVERAGATRFMRWLRAERGLEFEGDPDALWRWSVEQLEEFWGAVWDYFELISDAPYQEVLDRRVMPGARWFEGARLNYAEHVLRNATDERPALLVLAEDQPAREVSWDRLRCDVAALAHTLRQVGVGPGDRVCGYLSNIPETVVGMLATVSLGAAWAVCAPDYGLAGAHSRFGQLEPKVLIAVDAYHFGGRRYDRREEIAQLQDRLPTLELTIIVPRIDEEPQIAAAGTIGWSRALAEPAELQIERVEFAHPLWVLFSSGTTGLPKGLVHSHGGMTIEQLKQGSLGHDIRREDRWYFYSSPNWAAWNTTLGQLLGGSTIALYDGSPGYPDLLANWRIVAETRATVFGTGAAYLTACEKARADLSALDLSALRLIITTGSVLPPSTYHWVYASLPSHVRLESAYGGTDVCTAFAGGSPLKPVIAGELNGCYPGVRAETWSAEGEPVIDQVGDLVITEPMPSMPEYLWNDPDGERYRATYFDMFPGVWSQGDWVRTTTRGTLVIEGRSDSTLNRGGVRMGSADVYAVVELLDGVADSLIVGVDLPGAEYYMPLFIVPAPGRSLDDALRQEIVEAIRAGVSPRHVPDEVIAAPGVPRTRTGKKLEVPIKRIIAGVPIDQAANRASVDRADLLEWYAAFAAQRRA